MISYPVNERTETPLDRSIVSKPRPSYESSPATLPALIYPSIEEGVRRNRAGEWVVDVRVRDPNTNKEIILENVRIEQMTRGIMQKVDRGGLLYLSVPDQRLLEERDTRFMTARWVNTNVGTENGAVPIDMVFNSFRNKITSQRARSCGTEKFDYEEEKKKFNTMEGLVIYADETNPDSSGLAIDTTTGETAIFNKYKENIIIGKKGITIDGKNFNRGTSSQTKQGIGTLGLPGRENEMQDMYPRSNILLNIPMLQMPYVAKFMDILYGVAFLYKMVRVGIVAAEFIKGKR